MVETDIRGFANCDQTSGLLHVPLPLTRKKTLTNAK